MAEEEALSALRDVFGNRPFKVKNMSNEFVIDISDLGGDAIRGRFNNRMKVGVWLTHMGVTQPDKVEILERNQETGRPGTYRIRTSY